MLLNQMEEGLRAGGRGPEKMVFYVVGPRCSRAAVGDLLPIRRPLTDGSGYNRSASFTSLARAGENARKIDYRLSATWHRLRYRGQPLAERYLALPGQISAIALVCRDYWPPSANDHRRQLANDEKSSRLRLSRRRNC